MKIANIMMAIAVLALAGCGGDAAGSGASASVTQIGQGLSPGEYELEVVGAVRSVGPYSGDREALRFSPSNYGQSRERHDGTGGRELVVANNVDGPFSVRLRADLQRGDEEPDRETGAVVIQLPPGARAGQSYPLETGARARHGEAILALNAYGQPLNFGGSGTVSVAELGEQISLQFEFRGGSAEDDNERHIIGRAYRVPLTRQGEARYRLSVDGGTEERIELARFRNARSMMVAQAMQINFDGEPTPGTYPIANRAAAGVVGLQLFEHRDAEISGEIELMREDDTWSARFRFQGEGDAVIRGEGGFDHVAAWSR